MEPWGIDIKPHPNHSYQRVAKLSKPDTHFGIFPKDTLTLGEAAWSRLSMHTGKAQELSLFSSYPEAPDLSDPKTHGPSLHLAFLIVVISLTILRNTWKI